MVQGLNHSEINVSLIYKINLIKQFINFKIFKDFFTFLIEFDFLIYFFSFCE